MSNFAALVDLIPEAVLLGGALVCCTVAAISRRATVRVYQGIVGVTLLGTTISALVYLRNMPRDGYVAYSDAIVVDRYAVFLVPTLCAFTLFTVLAGDSLEDRIRPHLGEYHALLLAATLGAVLLVSAREMIAFYIALELLSVSLYVLVGIVKTDARGSEAAFKYLIIGAASSAVLLYGLAILYGLTGETDLVAVGTTLTHNTGASALGLTLVLAGLCFKLGAVPFHQWVPDVYEGASAPVAGFIATLSKTAGFAIIARVAVTALPASSSNWTALLAIISAATMVYGNVVALAQRDVKRLLAYSSIGQAGFILLGLLAFHQDQQGISAMLFYLFTYGISVVGVFAVVAYLDGAGMDSDLESYRGLSQRNPIAAATLGLGMVSLVGIPPLIGFFAKFFIFQAAVIAGYAWLVLIALTMTVVSAGYYLRVLKVVYVDPPADDDEPLDRPAWTLAGAIAVCGLAMVGLGAAAQPLFALATGGGGQIH
ncbi:MAG TPA: NADH-quinone oxidoreductase subunit N [Candidatus Dormibacteraeota bacterium]|nr:NADH-quinone oxidoreductase subunit N [Candidatus Dormibacteraeota bacterium]